MPILAICNPACGPRTAKPFFEEQVLPLLALNNKSPNKVQCTEYPSHSGILVVDFLKSFEGDITVVLASGDGTLHEIVDHLASTHLRLPLGDPPPSIRFVLVPCGTANALFSSLFPPTTKGEEETAAYRLRSVQAFVNGTKVVPLNPGIASFYSPASAQEQGPSNAVISAIVMSTAAHALILRDSEALRATMPGVERFKVAAERSRAQWFKATVRLFPNPGACVTVYDPAKDALVPHPNSQEDCPIIDMDGPFAYFLATINVDRLEPKFKITPLVSAIPATERSFDIVIVRPMRSPIIATDTQEARETYAQNRTKLFQAAYDNGDHLKLRYDEDGTVGKERNGPLVVEYIRCGGWEWIPVSGILDQLRFIDETNVQDETDEEAHVVCIDGAINTIDRGGRMVAEVAKHPTTYLVHV
jgi:hypothetical protein